MASKTQMVVLRVPKDKLAAIAGITLPTSTAEATSINAEIRERSLRIVDDGGRYSGSGKDDTSEHDPTPGKQPICDGELGQTPALRIRGRRRHNDDNVPSILRKPTKRRATQGQSLFHRVSKLALLTMTTERRCRTVTHGRRKRKRVASDNAFSDNKSDSGSTQRTEGLPKRHQAAAIGLAPAGSVNALLVDKPAENVGQTIAPADKNVAIRQWLVVLAENYSGQEFAGMPKSSANSVVSKLPSTCNDRPRIRRRDPASIRSESIDTQAMDQLWDLLESFYADSVAQADVGKFLWNSRMFLHQFEAALARTEKGWGLILRDLD
ncbi:uncharacterized protein AB675_454 [Cyphellophora attinorum]|uniref:Uncharacterized protein n=1 Tax=Cyphellophora attinorum TaxID=1664694 RepID=A0A0N0NS88_9EURO|nr:uncharacterized protein AB675_454 [Phialophora attinorum]KPI45971.1 hypothetical protein AB675_454 [Phialophora attinorum]